MKTIKFIMIILSFLATNNLLSQTIDFNRNNLDTVGVKMSLCEYKGIEAVKVIKDSNIKEPDQPTFVKLKNIDFKNGIIEINLLSKLVENAGQDARGFIGIAFRINSDNSKFECIYLRPTNARSNDQSRRNHTIQYFSFPDYNFFRLRKEAPDKYESYADMTLNEWIKVKIVIKDTNAQLYINDAEKPCLNVDDLKHGKNYSGSIGLWVDTGTEGYFSDLNITQ
jgi:hypothetical protein